MNVRPNRLKQWILWPALLALLGVVGCAQPSGQTVATQLPTKLDSTPWIFDGRPGQILKTEHYTIYTTMDDRDYLLTLTQVMEGANQQYQSLTPGVPQTTKPMECFIFARRPQWQLFTRQNTGDDAHVYLQINRGGYTIRDWFVAYYIGDLGTYSVAAHEGWHQYVARHFKSRLPPFLEEGMATMFENITWPGPTHQPHWNLAVNLSRADKLKTAIQEQRLWPLDQLCTMHAGDVVAMSGEKIETFYAQDWAFAQFLLHAENGKYLPAFHKMLTDLSSGESDTWTGHHRGPPGTWDPRSVRPLLEHYLGMSMKQIDDAYQAYMRQVANQKA